MDRLQGKKLFATPPLWWWLPLPPYNMLGEARVCVVAVVGEGQNMRKGGACQVSLISEAGKETDGVD
jgi:hypothetical protein